jgi:hypothetical protein
MQTAASVPPEAEVWGDYVNYADVARFDYGRLLWRQPAMRARLLRHWLDEQHPGHERFRAHRAEVEEMLSSEHTSAQLNELCRQRGTSLRCLVREIPPVFGGTF